MCEVCGYQCDLCFERDWTSVEGIERTVRNLLYLLKWVGSDIRKYRLEWYNPKGSNERKKDVTSVWLEKDAEGIFLVQLIGSGGYNHFVCKDAREPDQKLIFDSMEKHAVKLTELSLSHCIGDNIELLEVHVPTSA